MLKQFSYAQFSRDAQLLTTATGIFAISFLGVQMLLKSLYILRLGYGLEYLGIFGATGAISYAAMSLPSGAVGNYLGIRLTMFCGGIVTIIGMAILPLVEFVPPTLHDAWPILSQAVISGGWAFFNVNLVPALMGATTPHNRNSAYALNSMLRGLGAFVGATLGGFLPSIFVYTSGYALTDPGPYRLGLWVAAGLGLIALAPLFMVRATTQNVIIARDQPHDGFPVMTVALLVLHVYFAQAGIAVCQTFCSAYMDRSLGLAPAIIGLITGAGQLMAVMSPLFAPRLAARYGNARVLMMTTLGASVSLLPLAFIPYWFGAGLGGLGITSLAAMWMPTLQVFQMESVDSRWRSLAYGIVSMAMSCTYASASFFGGQIASQWGYQRLFLLSIGMTMIGVLLMWVMNRKPTLVAARSS